MAAQIKRAKTKIPHSRSATATYVRSLEFLTAGNRLYALGAKHRARLSNPIYFLYFHAIELAFKAYLYSYNIEPPRNHDLVQRYDDCHRVGLVVGPHDLTNIRNVLRLLESGNQDHAFRYFNPDNGNLPDLRWTKSVAADLLRVVGRRMRAIGYTSRPGPAVSVRLVVSRL